MDESRPEMPDFGYRVDDRRMDRTMVVFDARTRRAESWLAHAAEARCTGVTGTVTGRELKLDARESRDFFAAFENAGLTVEGFGGKRSAPAST